MATLSDYHLDLPKEDIDAVLRTKRKAREPKACYPCHSRKVKCDQKLPCDSCIKRDHADLCTYERPLKRRQLGLAGGHASGDEHSNPDSPTYLRPVAPEDDDSPAPNFISVPRLTWERMREDLRSVQDTISRLRSGQTPLPTMNGPSQEHGSNRAESDTGIHAESDRMGTVHLGSRSVLAYMMGLGRSRSSQEAAKSVLEEDVLPKLGLDNENVTYPFVDLWSAEQSTNNVNGLCLTLPDDNRCRESFTFYRDVACTIYPVVYDTAGFEATMENMIRNRASSGGLYTPPSEGRLDKPFGVSISWLGLFFAVLASGSQSSNLPAKQRELTSQVYICCAYQALRMTNFMSYPSLEAVQTLLIIANVLAYNMNPGNAYVVLGMALRIALVLGLQSDSPKFSAQETYARRRVWWALAWQDSHFSVSYDRPTAAAFMLPEIPYQSTPGNRPYPEAMFQVINLTLEILRLRVLQPRSSMPISTILEYKDRLGRIMKDGAPYLRDRRNCTKQTEHIERLVFKLHCGYITSELCRPAVISPSNGRPKHERSANAPDQEVIAKITQDFIVGLRRTITAYLEMHTITPLGTRFWIGIQRAVSAAFLLAIHDETRGDPEVHSILRALEEVISLRVTFDNDPWTATDTNSPYATTSTPSTQGSISGAAISDSSPHWAKSMSQSLKALSKLNNVLADPNAQAASAPIPVPATHGTMLPTSPDLVAGMVIKPQNAAALLLQASNDHSLITPITPESTGSSDWNVANLVERVGQYVQAPLW